MPASNKAVTFNPPPVSDFPAPIEATTSKKPLFPLNFDSWPQLPSGFGLEKERTKKGTQKLLGQPNDGNPKGKPKRKTKPGGHSRTAETPLPRPPGDMSIFKGKRTKVFDLDINGGEEETDGLHQAGGKGQPMFGQNEDVVLAEESEAPAAGDGVESTSDFSSFPSAQKGKKKAKTMLLGRQHDFVEVAAKKIPIKYGTGDLYYLQSL